MDGDPEWQLRTPSKVAVTERHAPDVRGEPSHGKPGAAQSSAGRLLESLRMARCGWQDCRGCFTSGFRSANGVVTSAGPRG